MKQRLRTRLAALHAWSYSGYVELCTRWNSQPFEDEGAEAQEDQQFGQCAHAASGRVWIAIDVDTAPVPGLFSPDFVACILLHSVPQPHVSLPCPCSRENWKEAKNVPRGEFGFTANLVRKLGLKLNQGGLKMSANKAQSQNFLAFTLLENYFTTNICLSVICVTRRFIFLPVQATAVVSQDGLLVAMAHGFLRLLVSWFQVIAHQMISLWLHLGIRACPTGLSQLPFCSLLIPLPPLWQRWVTDDEIRWLPSSRSFFENVSLLFHRLRRRFP